MSSAWKARWEPSRSVWLSVSCRCHHQPWACVQVPPAGPSPCNVAGAAFAHPVPHLEDVLGDDVVVGKAVQQREDVVHRHGDLGAVQLQQLPQVPVTAWPSHAEAAATRLGRAASPDAPL